MHKIIVQIIGILFFITMQSYCCFGQNDSPMVIDNIPKESLSYWITSQVLDYFDLRYCFPATYNDVHDTCLYFYHYYTKEDSLLLNSQQRLRFINEDDTILVALFDKDTLTKIKVPCNCDDDLNQDFPSGPRAFDSQSNYMDLGTATIDGELWDRLWIEMFLEEIPSVKQEMESYGYLPLYFSERKEYRFLLCQYCSDTDSLVVVNACKNSKHLLDELYCSKLRQTFNQYCKANGISLLLTPVWILVPPTKEMKNDGN